MSSQSEKSQGKCPFTGRQLEVIKWLSLGKTAADIAEILGRAKTTVESHAEQSRRVIGVANATSLVAMSLRNGWID